MPIFGNLSEHAGRKYLLSLEGHAYWSFRLRQLLFLSSAVLHQDLPCAEFWHAALRPYEHYVPISRDLSDLRSQMRYLKARDTDARRMVRRMRRLAARLLSRRAVLAYVRELLERYAELMTAPVALHPAAAPFARDGRARQRADS